MADVKRAIIDADHDGEEPGAMCNGRREENDTLQLTLAIGQILENNGVDMVHARTMDIHDTPLEKTQTAGQSRADYFMSIRRSTFLVSGGASNVITSIYQSAGVSAMLVDNIQHNLVRTGSRDLGVQEHPGLIVLRRT